MLRKVKEKNYKLTNESKGHLWKEKNYKLTIACKKQDKKALIVTILLVFPLDGLA
jgi:hypothetical protein